MNDVVEIINTLLLKGVSRYQISKDTGISQATLSLWYHGKRTPSKSLAMVLENYYINILKET